MLNIKVVSSELRIRKNMKSLVTVHKLSGRIKKPFDPDQVSMKLVIAPVFLNHLSCGALILLSLHYTGQIDSVRVP